MFPAGLIVFREMLEVVLVLGVVFATLSQDSTRQLRKYVWWGVLGGAAVAGGVGYALHRIEGALDGAAHQVVEGMLMLVTAGFLTWMIFWVHGQSHARKLRETVTRHVARGFGIGLFIIALTAVVREGVETSLYIETLYASTRAYAPLIVGSILGIALACGVGYLVFTALGSLNLKRIFSISNVLMALFAAGLLLHGIHELQDAGVLPYAYIDPVVNLTTILNEESAAGEFVHVLFGYSSTPTLLGLYAYCGYLISLVWMLRMRS